MRIVLGEWRPDAPAAEGLARVENAAPAAAGHWLPWPALAGYGEPLPEPVRGAAAGKAATLDTTAVAGTANGLWRLAPSGEWLPASRPGGYATPEEERWRFAVFGDTMVATNYADPPQAMRMGAATAFADLSPTAPRARHLAVVRDTLVFGGTWDGTDGERPLRVRWSPLGDPAGDWTPDPERLTDFQDLPSGGQVAGIVGGEYGSIICESAIHRMTFAGPPLAFQFDAVVPGRGCIAPGSLASDGRLTVFLAEDGFYTFDGAEARPIGAGRVDRWFFNDASPDFRAMSAVMDPQRQLYVLAYASANAEGGLPDSLLLWEWTTGRFATVRQPLQMLVRLATAGHTLETLDELAAAVEGLPASLDARLWAGGAPIQGAFDPGGRLATFGGAPLPALFETAEAGLLEGQRARVRLVRPLADGVAEVSIGTRDSLDTPPAFTPWRGRARDGAASFRADARFHRARLRLSGDWSAAFGFEVEAVPAGRS